MEQDATEITEVSARVAQKFQAMEKRIQQQASHSITIDQTFEGVMNPLNYMFQLVNGATANNMGVIYEVHEDPRVMALREATWPCTNEITKLLPSFRQMSYMGMTAHMRLSDAHNVLLQARQLFGEGLIPEAAFDRIHDLVKIKIEQIEKYLPQECENVRAQADKIKEHYGQMATVYEAFSRDATYH